MVKRSKEQEDRRTNRQEDRGTKLTCTAGLPFGSRSLLGGLIGLFPLVDLSVDLVDYSNIKFGGLILEEHARIVCCASRTKCCSPNGGSNSHESSLGCKSGSKPFKISRRRMPIVMNIGGIDEQGLDEANGHGRTD